MELDVSMQDTFILKVTGDLWASIWLPRERTNIDCVPIPKHRNLAVRDGPHVHIYRARGCRRMGGGHGGHVHLETLTGKSWMKGLDFLRRRACRWYMCYIRRYQRDRSMVFTKRRTLFDAVG